MAKYVVLALVAIWTVASDPIGLALWPPAAGMPPTQLLPVIALVGLFEGAAFALGVVFHTTLILGTAAVTIFFIRAIRPSAVVSGPQPAAEPAVPTA